MSTTIHDAVVAKKGKITRIVGDITLDGIDTLKDQIGQALIKVKSRHFTKGAKYGHLAVITG